MPLPSLTQTEIDMTFILFKKNCKKNLIYLRKYRTKEIFANPTKFDIVYKKIFVYMPSSKVAYK